LKKRSKKLLIVFCPGDVSTSRVKVAKVFCGAFFQKSDRFLSRISTPGLAAPCQAPQTKTMDSDLRLVTSNSRGLLAFTLALVIAILLCMEFLDRPVAIFFAAHRHWRWLFRLCAAPSLLALPVAAVCLAAAVARRLLGRPGISRVWLATSLATLASTAAKDELKFLFGRPWPSTWLESHVYAFHPFTDSVSFGGFPSGHTAYISAPLCVCWALLPRYRWLWGGVIFLVMAGLVGADYHFVADVLAGLLVGITCAWGCLVLLPRDV